MDDRRATNRAMFWRIMRRLFGANPGRLFVMLLALGAGAAVTAALLNLQVDAKRRLTTEFRAFGPNIAILPRDSGVQSFEEGTLDEALLRKIPASFQGNQVIAFGTLAVVANVYPQTGQQEKSANYTPVVVVGYSGGVQQEMLKRAQAVGLPGQLPYCDLGEKAASVLGAHENDRLVLRNASVEVVCSVSYVLPYGGQQDNQISVHVSTAQHLAGLAGRLNSIQVLATGTPSSINSLIELLAKDIPEADVRPIHQFTEAQSKIYNRISGLLNFTVGIVLVLTTLCVMAAMTNVAMERKMDVGLMKAIGGSMRRVLRLFLAEAALLGLAGGIIGAGVGIFLSIGLGKAVFGVAARPRLIVYPVAVALTVIVAILSAFPLRQLASIRPASVFRGEA